MGVIKVTDHQGKTHILEAVEGWRIMEIIREHGLPIEGLCGGACECATCHVHIAPEWLDKIHPAREDEEDQLDTVPFVEKNSRLSCQIIYEPELDGLELSLPKPAEAEAA